MEKLVSGVKLSELKYADQFDNMTLATRIVEMVERYSPDAIFVDEGGVGGGVVDRLNMLRQPVQGVQFGSKADKSVADNQGSIGYANKRAEMWGSMREWLKGASIPDDPDLAAQLTSIEYGYVTRDNQDVILLEKKSDMKKRGLSSPDKADALALTFAYPVASSQHAAPFGSKKGSFINDYNPLDDKYILTH